MLSNVLEYKRPPKVNLRNQLKFNLLVQYLFWIISYIILIMIPYRISKEEPQN